MVIREIKWTKRANNSYNLIIDYIFTNFGENATKSFVQNTYKHIERLAKFPNMGSIEDTERAIRGFVISKHNTMFYRVRDKEIIILNIFSNQKNPRRMKY